MNKCALIDNNGMCMILHQKAVKNCKCPNYTSLLNYCGICGNADLNPLLCQLSGDQWVPICANCYSKFDTCEMCTEKSTCLFETDENPEPQFIIQTFQQNNMIMQKQVPNPKRIAATCHYCKCWNATEQICNKRTFNTCSRYNEQSIFTPQNSDLTR
jgi:hypothetical protein